jgi:predicted RNA-binding protein with EMAP domain|tara:strand:+ start:6421 stop:6594 length:174 start_codon:yes stop_codon:yes gene_type:complete
MSYTENLLKTYEAEIQSLRAAYLKEQEISIELNKTIEEKEIIIKLLKNKNKAYDKFN